MQAVYVSKHFTMNKVENHLIIKKYLRLVAEKYSFSTNYLNETISISNDSRQISIEPERNEIYNVNYKYSNQSQNLSVSVVELFDLIITWLKYDEINVREGKTITIEDWISEELVSLDKIEKTLSNLKENNLESYEFGGNRIMAEYYKEIIILTDDLGIYKSAVIVI